MLLIFHEKKDTKSSIYYFMTDQETSILLQFV